MKKQVNEHGPTYKFMCTKCGLSMTQSMKMSSSQDETKWPLCDCGERMQKTWISPQGGFILKGKGWYKKGGY